jgi:anaerobic ribonucleoside-triphosphate reductase activating protein
VLVDGPFVKSLRDETLHFRGSRNQRLVDVPSSLEQGEVVELS